MIASRDSELQLDSPAFDRRWNFTLSAVKNDRVKDPS